VRYPTLSDDVAGAILELRDRGFTGTIHMRGPTRATRFEMWHAMAQVFELPDAHITPAPRPVTAEAARPRDSMLGTNLYDGMQLPAFHSFPEGLRGVRALMESSGYDWRAS
jgi:dTDP-4-dehydrorhamnose reductase